MRVSVRFSTTPPPLKTFASTSTVYVLPFTGRKPERRTAAAYPAEGRRRLALATSVPLS